MQIPPTAAASAAGNVSQAASKDRASAPSTADAAAMVPQTALAQVARSEQASADRDAEGGMYGRMHKPKPGEPSLSAPTESKASGLPVKEPEPPSQLDVLG